MARSSERRMRIAISLDMAGRSRPRVEYSQRGYKADFTFEDPYLFDTDYAFKMRLSALTYDYDGYSKFEVGGRFTLNRKISDQYEVGLVYSPRHVEITDATIKEEFLGRTSYFVSSIGFTQTLDLRKNPLVAPRGFVFDNTVDLATSAVGSELDFLRATARLSYYRSFAPDPAGSWWARNWINLRFQRWFERSSARLWGSRRNRLSARDRRDNHGARHPD